MLAGNATANVYPGEWSASLFASLLPSILFALSPSFLLQVLFEGRIDSIMTLQGKAKVRVSPISCRETFNLDGECNGQLLQ